MKYYRPGRHFSLYTFRVFLIACGKAAPEVFYRIRESRIMSRKLSYDHVDVFTSKPFGGNQLAVFHSPGRLTRNQMQKIAREMNFSETTFVLPSKSSDVDGRVRIFTPAEEIPFAGHPIIGTAYVIQGRKKGKKPDKLLLECDAGLIEVEISATRTKNTLTMTQPAPEFGTALQNRGQAARAVGIKSFEVMGGGVVSNGLDFLIVEARDEEIVGRAQLNMEEATNVISRHGVIGIYLFTRVESRRINVKARFFAPSVGVMEDPATGSAAGALGGYLARILKFPQELVLKIEQGKEIGRKSFLRVEVGCDRGIVQNVKVAGSVAPVGEGFIRL